jgi:hypothetical protein
VISQGIVERPQILLGKSLPLGEAISYWNSWIHRYPKFAKRGEGVMIILEPSQINEPPKLKGAP